LMSEAYQHVAHGPIRNRGTLCGNLCHADPASEMPAVAIVSDAIFVLQSKRGQRRVAAKDFFLGVYETATQPDEMLVEVRVPVSPKGQGWSFQEVSVRKGDFAIVGVAVTVTLSEDKINNAAVAVCGVGNRAVRLATVEAGLISGAADSKAFDKAANGAAAAIDPQTDMNADPAYRRDLVRTLVGRALKEAVERAG
jgi:aerobic carbon-monoxide dehydrogenase medium subunit